MARIKRYNSETQLWEYADTSYGIKGETGADGKSAYEYAQDGGYSGTEEEFAEKLAKEIPEVFVVTVNNMSGEPTADKNFAEIEAAYQAGKRIECVLIDSASLGYPAYLPLSCRYQISSTSFVFMGKSTLLSYEHRVKITDGDVVTVEMMDIMERVDALKNPKALSIDGTSYDGSSAVDFTSNINALIDAKVGVIENGAY